MKQKDWIQQLFGDVRPSGFDPYVEVHREDAGLKYGRWQKWEGQDHVDERSILPNELVFDADADSTKACVEANEAICSTLDEFGIPYVITDTGGTGFHIHAWFELPESLDELGNYRGARIAIYERITDELPDDVEAVLDDGVVWFDESRSKGHLIRAIGGRKTATGRRKTVTDADFTKHKITEADEVTYPQAVEPFTIGSGYTDTPFTVDEITEKAAEIKQRERRERQRAQTNTYEADGNGLDHVRQIPAPAVLTELGKTVSNGDQIICVGHSDTEPSMMIRDDKAICWGSCGQPGKPAYKNAIDLVIDVTDKGFEEAVDWLCDTFEVDNPLTEDKEEAQINPTGDVTFDSETFVVAIRDPHIKSSSGKLTAEIEAWLKDTGESHYARTTISRRGVKGFTRTLGDLYDISDNQEKELLRAILRKKKEIRDAIDSGSEQEADKDVTEVVKGIYQYPGTPTLDEVRKMFGHFGYIQRQHRDLILVDGSDNVILTEKGQKKAETALGVEHTEDPDKEADDILEEGALTYYLKAFSKLHKGDHLLKIWELLSALSAIGGANRQINSWAVGPSGKGKSALKRHIIDKFLPDDTYMKPNSISPKALMYWTEKEGTDYFKNKLLYFDEAESEDDDEKIPLLRSITDQDEDLVTHATVKDQEIQTLVLELPVTVWFTSVETINDEQLKNRFILTNPDGSEDLDKKVFRHQRDILHSGGDLDFMPKEGPIIQRMVKHIRKEAGHLNPVLPFDVDWKQKFNRRLYPYFVTVVGLIARINYKNRKTEDGYILCTKADYELASMLWTNLIATTIAQQDQEAIRLLRNLPGERGERVNTSDIASELSGYDTSKAYRKAKNLMQTEELSLVNGEKENGRWYFWAGADREKLTDPEPELELSLETVDTYTTNTPFAPTEETMDYINDTSIPVVTDLRSKDTGREMAVASSSIDAVTDDDLSETPQGKQDKSTEKQVKPLKQKILDVVEAEGGIMLGSIAERFDSHPESEIEDAINDMVSNGELYEPKPGQLHKL